MARSGTILQPDMAHGSTLAGVSSAMGRVRAQLLRIAPYLRIALIVGETGTGKYAVAAQIHRHSLGTGGPFVVRRAETLLGAPQPDAGFAAAMREATGGTLFLEEVCGLPLASQSRLLHLLRRMDTLRAQRGELRILASSRRDLRALAAIGHYNDELYRRIAAVEIVLPPLRSRPEDLAAIAQAELGPRSISLSPAALARLEQHSWPQNLRELRQVLAAAAEQAEGCAIEPGHLHLGQPAIKTQQAERPEPRLERLDAVIRRHVLEVLTHCAGNKLRASEVLGISRSTLYRMLDACAG